MNETQNQGSIVLVIKYSHEYKMIRNLLASSARRLQTTPHPSNPHHLHTLHLLYPLNSLHKPRYYCHRTDSPRQLLLRRTNKYLDLVNSLKQKSELEKYLAHANRLLNSNNKFTNYRLLKSFINDMLLTMQIVRWAQAYHDCRENQLFIRYLNRVQDLIKLSFSSNLSASHQSLQQEASQFFQTLRFSTYYQMVENPSAQISTLYVNSYIHINRQRSPQQYVKVYQALRELKKGEAEVQIMEMSQLGIKQLVSHIDFGKPGQISEVQMSMYLTYLRTHLTTMTNQQHSDVKTRLLRHIQEEKAAKESFLFMQNICYCLYVGVTKLDLHQDICRWLQNKLTAGYLDGLIQYLTTLFSHEDKLTCIKTDIWIELQLLIKNNAQIYSKYNKVQPTSAFVLEQVYSISYSTWRYKYIVWMLHIICDHKLTNLTLINKLVQAVTTQKLASNHSLSSLTLALKTLSAQLTLSQIYNIDFQIAKWLSQQSKQSLLSQPRNDLFEILHYADRHPALHPVYLPYLQRLLQVSLGQFQWKALTEIYYFGLRWQAVEQSEASYWKMEYVRRYILNEYAEMGITRRDIPEDSYFYRLLAQTTPEKFYKNYIQYN